MVRADPTREPPVAWAHTYQLYDETFDRVRHNRSNGDPDHDQCNLDQTYPLQADEPRPLVALSRAPVSRSGTGTTHGVAIPTNPPTITVTSVPGPRQSPSPMTFTELQGGRTSPSAVLTLEMSNPTPVTPTKPKTPVIKFSKKRRPSPPKKTMANTPANTPLQPSNEGGGSPAQETLTHGFGVVGDPRPASVGATTSTGVQKKKGGGDNGASTMERLHTSPLKSKLTSSADAPSPAPAPPLSLDTRASPTPPTIKVQDARTGRWWQAKGASKTFHAGVFGRDLPNTPVWRSSAQDGPTPPPAPSYSPPPAAYMKPRAPNSPRSPCKAQSPRMPRGAGSGTGSAGFRTRKMSLAFPHGRIARYADFFRAFEGRGLKEREIRLLWVEYQTS
mmetsp:Transcript_105916/g.306358  ORF Transcript_105916/g.306358 Transcript_105916/m.306358 type:complete len:389 (-) Transcript_105916:388-1554(-)